MQHVQYLLPIPALHHCTEFLHICTLPDLSLSGSLPICNIQLFKLLTWHCAADAALALVGARSRTPLRGTNSRAGPVLTRLTVAVTGHCGQSLQKRQRKKGIA